MALCLKLSLNVLFVALLFFSSNAIAGKKEPLHAGAPGYGYPGELAPYEASSKLQEQMERFNLTAGWFRRAAINPEVEHTL